MNPEKIATIELADDNITSETEKTRLTEAYNAALKNSFDFEFHGDFENDVVRSNDTHTSAVS